MATAGARPQQERNQACTIWVGNLDETVTQELLWELFLQAGPVVSVFMPRDKITGLHQNYAFVEFENEADADYAMKIMNMIKLYGKSMRINRASREKDVVDIGANLFVGNLDKEVDEQVLYNTMSAFGQVLDVKVMTDENGIHKGFGFVHFASFEASDLALESMNGQYICNRPIHVSYAYKRDGSKGERHGSAAERALAANRTDSTAIAQASTRAHMQFGGGAVPGHLPQVPPAMPASMPPPPTFAAGMPMSYPSVPPQFPPNMPAFGQYPSAPITHQYQVPPAPAHFQVPLPPVLFQHQPPPPPSLYQQVVPPPPPQF